jgi:hypothetical protein
MGATLVIAKRAQVDDRRIRPMALQALGSDSLFLQTRGLYAIEGYGGQDDADAVLALYRRTTDPDMRLRAGRTLARLGNERVLRQWLGEEADTLIRVLKRSDIEIDARIKVEVAGLLSEVGDAAVFRAWTDAMPEIEEAERMRLAREREFILQAAREGGGRAIGLDEMLAREPTLRQIREKLKELEARVQKRPET